MAPARPTGQAYGRGMRTFRLRPPQGAITVDEGVVRCPFRDRDVDVEQCYSCRLRKDMGVTNGQQWVRCRTDITDLFSKGIVS